MVSQKVAEEEGEACWQKDSKRLKMENYEPDDTIRENNNFNIIITKIYQLHK
jgi:hypothetical protein